MEQRHRPIARARMGSARATVGGRAGWAASKTSPRPEETEVTIAPIARQAENDYTHEAAETRRRAVCEVTGAKLDHVGSFSFEPELVRGNVENFAGVAQVPLGFAGPLVVNGEHAKGEFYVPLATAE